MSLFYWSYNHRHRCSEALMYYRVSCGFICGTVFVQVPSILQSVKAHVASKMPLDASVSKKAPVSKMSREAFVAAVMSLFPLAGPRYAEALAAATVTAQDKFSDEIVYDSFFDKVTAAATSGSQVVYDQLVRLIIAHTELIHLAVEEKLFAEMRTSCDARFAALKRLREENGVTGKAGLHPLLLESTAADASGKVDVATFARVLKLVDPHCRKRTLYDRIGAAARAPEFVRAVCDGDTAAQDSVMNRLVDVNSLLKSFRAGVFPTIAPPLASGEVDEPFPK
jgi:hypothetical protein